MLSNNETILRVGDWIKGKSRDGELFIGYIESLDILDDKVNATITSSDDESMVGKTIPMSSNGVKKLPDPKVQNKEQIQYLIDLALATGDEEWFLELSEQLKSIRELVKGIRV
ncbi:IDEAL domain-containing protein [Mesobacillus jeotgali]|uniref:IDEAL domain-containing protein n=1 Tax=Mesobacillus jeotgali TaxID=129985 RepID=A0ABY9VNQ6_9BACI|nr:IDEAL domain-containing protein [Mesobacillus jeotgali]WNF24779.1 IDEAL domain-containing protein [Mesobacillus jeotgali]